MTDPFERRSFYLDGSRQLVQEPDGTVHEADPSDPDLALLHFDVDADPGEPLVGGWPTWAVDEVAMHRPFPRLGAITTRDRRLCLVVGVQPAEGRRPTFATVWLLPIHESWVSELVGAAIAVADGRRVTLAQRMRLARAVATFRPSPEAVAGSVAVDRPDEPGGRA